MNNVPSSFIPHVTNDEEHAKGSEGGSRRGKDDGSSSDDMKCESPPYRPSSPEARTTGTEPLDVDNASFVELLDDPRADKNTLREKLLVLERNTREKQKALEGVVVGLDVQRYKLARFLDEISQRLSDLVGAIDNAEQEGREKIEGFGDEVRAIAKFVDRKAKTAVWDWKEPRLKEGVEEPSSSEENIRAWILDVDRSRGA